MSSVEWKRHDYQVDKSSHHRLLGFVLLKWPVRVPTCSAPSAVGAWRGLLQTTCIVAVVPIAIELKTRLVGQHEVN